MKLSVIALCAAIGGLSSAAVADLSLTYNIFEDSPPPLNQSGLALGVFISSPVAGTVDFRFSNNSTGINAGAVITSMHFQQVPFASNLSFNSIVGNSSTPLISFATSSGNPPGGNNISWGSSFYVAERTNGSGGVSRGLNTGEFVTIRFNLLNGTTLAQVEQNVQATSGRMRIASHVQALDAGQSVSVQYVVPTPGAGALVALGGLVASRRRRA